MIWLCTESFKMDKNFRIGALISGSGTNLQAIIDSCETGKIKGNLVFVGSDNPAAKGIERARRYKIPTFVVDYSSIIKRFKRKTDKTLLPDDFDFNDLLSKQTLVLENVNSQKPETFIMTRAIIEKELLDKMKPYPFDLLILAGFMRNLTPYFIDRVNTDPDHPRIMNIHPALLPAFPGTNGYGDTFQYGCKVGDKIERHERQKETRTSDGTCNGMYGSSGNYNRHGRNAPLLQYASGQNFGP